MKASEIAPLRSGSLWLGLGALLLALSILASCYPGIASYDLVYIFAEWQRGFVGDWHPPILMRFWTLLLALGLRGTGQLFAVQILLFWCGLGLLAAARSRAGAFVSGIAVLAVGLLPPVFGFLGEVLKDSQLVAALVAAVGLTGWYRFRPRPIPPLVLAVIALLFLYATLLRPNAIFSTLPLAVGLAGRSADGRRSAIRAAIAGMMVILLVAATPWLNAHVFGARADHAERSQQLFDMAGIAHESRAQIIPGVDQAAWAKTEGLGCYNPYGWDGFSQFDGCRIIWESVRNRPLGRAWIGTILAHPLAYARHRLVHWNESLRFLVPRSEPRGTAQRHSTPNPWQLGSDDPMVPTIGYRLQKITAATPLGWPFAWLAVGIVLIWAASAMRPTPMRDIAVVLAFSGCVQAISLLFVSVAADLRYHLWPITAIAIGIALLIGEPLPRARLRISGSIILGLCLLAAAARFVLVPAWPAGF